MSKFEESLWADTEFSQNYWDDASIFLINSSDPFFQNILNDPDFKEDAVREEIITPLLKELGYAATGENRIVRSKTLKQPFIYVGTSKHPVKIIPDYILLNNELKKGVRFIY